MFGFECICTNIGITGPLTSLEALKLLVYEGIYLVIAFEEFLIGIENSW